MAALLTLAQYHMNYGNDHMDSGWGWAMGAFMVVVAVTLIVLVVWMVRTIGPQARHASGPPSSAMDVLDRRLASGEITPDEYRERAAVLRRE